MKRSASARVAINKARTPTASQPDKPEKNQARNQASSSATSSFTTPRRQNDGRRSTPKDPAPLNNNNGKSSTDKSRRENTRAKRGKGHVGRVTIQIGDAANHFWHRLFPSHLSDRIGRGGPPKSSKQNWKAKWRGVHIPSIEGQINGGWSNIQSGERRGGVTDKILLSSQKNEVELQNELQNHNLHTMNNNTNATLSVTDRNEETSPAPGPSHPSVPLYPLLACILLYYAVRNMFSFKRRSKVSRMVQGILPGGTRQLVVSQDELAQHIKSLRPSNRKGETLTSPSLARDRIPSENGDGTPTPGTPNSNGVSDQQIFLDWMEHEEELHLARVKCEQLTADAVCANVRAEILAEQLKAIKEKGREKKDKGDENLVDGPNLPNSRSIDGVTDQASFIKWMRQRENIQIALSRLDELTSDAVCAQELAEMAREELDVLKHENTTIKDEKEALARTLEKESALHSQAIEEAAIVSEENSLLKDKVISLESENIFLDKEMERLMNELSDAAPPEVADVHEGETLEYKSNESNMDSLTEDLGDEEAVDIHMEAKVTALQAAIDEMASCHNAEKAKLKMSIADLENELDISKTNGASLTRQLDEAMRKAADLTCDNERLKEEVDTLLETKKAEERGEADMQTAAIDSELMDELFKLRSELSILQDDMAREDAIQAEADQGPAQYSEGDQASRIEEDLGRLVQEKIDLSMELSSVNNTLSMVQAENAKLSEEIRAGQSSSAEMSFDLPRAFEIDSSYDEVKNLEQSLSTVNVQLTKAYNKLTELMMSMEAAIEAQGCEVPTLTAECLEPYVSSDNSLQENAKSQAAALLEQIHALMQLQEGQINAFRPVVGPGGMEVLALQKSSSDSERCSAINTTASSMRSECSERSTHESPQGANASRSSSSRKKTTSLRRLWKKNTKEKSEESHNTL